MGQKRGSERPAVLEGPLVVFTSARARANRVALAGLVAVSRAGGVRRGPERGAACHLEGTRGPKEWGS